jgi:hypothetical protein
MDEYRGDLADGNRASFVLTVAPDGKAVTECGFLKRPTEENIAQFEDGMRMILEAGRDPDPGRPLRGGSNN